jgi:catechol 2,3-dioxygenase-like lactoylglutathione lyase family enzyme
MIRGIHHTAISTSDLQRSVRFYRDLLGFQEVFSSSWEIGSEVADRIVGLKDSAAQLVMLRLGNVCLELFQYASPRPKPGESTRPVCDHGITHICLDVTDIEAEYERLKAAGMRFHCPPQDVGGGIRDAGGIRATYGRDPDGNVVELLEVKDAGNPLSVRVG